MFTFYCASNHISINNSAKIMNVSDKLQSKLKKLKLLVTVKLNNPRCFKSIKSFDVDCEFNKKNETWLLKLDKKFPDNSAAHSKHVETKLKKH